MLTVIEWCRSRSRTAVAITGSPKTSADRRDEGPFPRRLTEHPPSRTLAEFSPAPSQGERQHRMIGPSETGGLVAVPHQAAERAGAASRLVVPRATGPVAPDRYACLWSHADWTPRAIRVRIRAIKELTSRQTNRSL